MNVIVIGAQWGDEGKGKVVDIFSAKAEYIVRYQGGNNAGHTLVVNGKKTVLHLIPSGILHAGKICLIANGVVFDPNIFFEEVQSLAESGVFKQVLPYEMIRVSERAHVILPYHRTLDRLREEYAGSGKGKIGTTVRGIGPAYEDKVARRGIQVIDLLRPQLLKTKLQLALEEKNILFKHLFNTQEVEFNKLYEECLKLGEKLKPYVANVRVILSEAVRDNRPILFEGAQGTLLDVDHGTYPYVTSSNTVTGGVLTGSGLGLNLKAKVIGITKAYTTRVGTGPFPTEIEHTEKELANEIRKIGAEFGATTGRPRRIGWLDLIALKYAVEVNGLHGLALMKADVLQGFDHVKICTGYRYASSTFYDLPSSIEDLEKVEPSYEILSGWPRYEKNNMKSFSDLPQEMQTFVRTIEDYLGIPVVLLSIGPGREETLLLQDPFLS
ncbi:MAG: adenylosuccinate synthase [Bdellovibrio sp.]|nr:adenylosuccinate synthase [Bdellovibrio sp.]